VIRSGPGNLGEGIRDPMDPETGPSLVRGTRCNEGQPRIITDTDPAVHELLASSIDECPVPYNDEVG
jgi:hypothetical protein